MNTSKIASNIIGDIYTFHNKYEKAKNKFENQEISENKFANAQYVILCKLTYLTEVINSLKENGYMFARYEKELCILTDLKSSINETLDQHKLSELTIVEQVSLTTYLTKYSNVLSIEEDVEELKDHT